MTQLTGTGPQVVAQGLHIDSAEQVHNLGELVHSNDGRAYRYCQAGAVALVAGKLQQSQAEITGDQNLTAVAAAIGDLAFVSTSTVTVTENEYAGGQVMITVTPGVGIGYGISGHTAYTAAAPTINLSDSILVALTTTSRADLVHNPYKAVVVNPTTITSGPVGVAIRTITASQYGWLQVRGIANVLADGTVTVGTDVVASDNTAGAVEVTADGTPEILSVVGTAMTGIATTEYGAIDLKLF